MLSPSDKLALGLITLGTFIGTLPLSLIMASLQAVAPNQLRGQLVAIFSFLANILGVASGPTIVALLTDYVYRDENAIGLSIATASLIVTPVVVTILGIGRAGLRDSLDRAAALYANPGRA
jgi:MFS family permease